MRHLIASLLLSGTALLSGLPAHAQWAHTCTRDPGSSVNLRNAPNTRARVIASLPDGSEVRLLSWVWGGDNMRWYRVESSGLVGFSRSDYLCR